MSKDRVKILGSPATWVEDFPINHGKWLHLFLSILKSAQCESASLVGYVRVKVPPVREKVVYIEMHLVA